MKLSVLIGKLQQLQQENLSKDLEVNIVDWLSCNQGAAWTSRGILNEDIAIHGKSDNQILCIGVGPDGPEMSFFKNREKK